MNQTLKLIISRIDNALTPQDLSRAVHNLRDYYHLKHAAYVWVNLNADSFICSTYPEEWVNHYRKCSYVRTDPVLNDCFQRPDPSNWKKADWTGKNAKALNDDIAAFQIGEQGVTIPLRGPFGQFAVLTFTNDCADPDWADFIQNNRHDFTLIGNAFNARAMNIASDRMPLPTKTLSPREVDALTFLAMGYGRSQVANMLSISEHTLRVYIESARFKLNAQNTVNAIAKAITEGAIIIGGSARVSGKTNIPQNLVA